MDSEEEAETMKPAKVDPRVQRTRRLLREALVQLTEERGLDGFSVQELADRATVKRATFYLHYEDKQALLADYIAELLEELRVAVFDPGGQPPDYDYASGEPHPSFVRLFRHLAERYDVYHALLVRRRVPELAAGMLEVVRQFVAEGLAFAQPDDRLLTARRDVTLKYTEAAYVEVIIWWIEQQMPYAEKEIAAQLMDLSIFGPYRELPAWAGSGRGKTSG